MGVEFCWCCFGGKGEALLAKFHHQGIGLGKMIIQGDALVRLRELQTESVDCCVSSPPYWGLRDYGVPGQLGLENSPQEYVAALVTVFQEVRRILKKDGTLWLNLGDCYASTGGAGTTGVVALKNGRQFIGIELNPNYCELATKRIYGDAALV